MSHTLPTALPLFDRRLLRAVEWIVPAAERSEWLRTWEAELWYAHQYVSGGRKRGAQRTADLSMGLIRDALWLRTDGWRLMYRGTASLCLGSLAGLGVLSILFSLALTGGWSELRVALAGPALRCLFAAPLIVFVTYATASRRHVELSYAGKALSWVRRQFFFVAKTLLILHLTFVLGFDVCRPLHVRLPGTADLLQILAFVIFTVFGLRWAFADQERRCKQCLRSLASPSQVGRPSYNLLEWNGTEQACSQGHGALSVPEMETSWCQYGRWTGADAVWDEPASV